MDELACIVLPCNHLALRPDRRRANISCPCGTQWEATLIAGNKAWELRALHTEVPA